MFALYPELQEVLNQRSKCRKPEMGYYLVVTDTEGTHDTGIQSSCRHGGKCH